MGIAPAPECKPLAEEKEDAMSKQTIGPKEAALQAIRAANKPAKATVPTLPPTSGKKPVKRKRHK